MTTKFKTLKEVPKDLSQRQIKMLFPTRTIPRKSLSPTYYPVDHHVYYDGSAFRVRVRIDGSTVSVSLSDKKKALKIRDKLLKKKTS